MIRVIEKLEKSLTLEIDQAESIAKVVGLILSIIKQGFKVSRCFTSTAVDGNKTHQFMFTKLERFNLKSPEIIATYYPRGSILRSISIRKLLYSGIAEVFGTIMYQSCYDSLIRKIVEEPATNVSSDLRVIHKFNILDIVNKPNFIDSIIAYLENLEDHKDLAALLCYLNRYDRYISKISIPTFYRFCQYNTDVGKCPDDVKMKLLNIFKAFCKSKAKTGLSFKTVLSFRKYSSSVLSIAICGASICRFDFNEKDDQIMTDPGLDVIGSFLINNNLLDEFEINIAKHILTSI